MVDADVSSQPMESYINAATLALGEMAGAQVFVRESSPDKYAQSESDVVALVELEAATAQMLILRFSRQTATAFAQRILDNANVELGDSLVQDCVGEIANVIAGQAKTLLAGTPHQMTFS